MIGVPLTAIGFTSAPLDAAPVRDGTGAAGAGAASGLAGAGAASGLAGAGAALAGAGVPFPAGALTGSGWGVVLPGAGGTPRCEPTTARTSLITRACSRGDLSMLR